MRFIQMLSPLNGRYQSIEMPVKNGTSSKIFLDLNLQQGIMYNQYAPIHSYLLPLLKISL